jgi:hypothetical protein
VRIPLLVPEPAIGRARLGVQLPAEQRSGLLIALIMRDLPEGQHRFAGIDGIELIFRNFVALDAAVRRDERTDGVFGELDVVRIVHLLISLSSDSVNRPAV